MSSSSLLIENELHSSSGELYVVIGKEEEKKELCVEKEHDSESQSPPSIVKLDRGSNLWHSSLYIFIYLLFETLKQLSTFGLTSTSIQKHRQFPIPKTLFMIFVELFKLGIIFVVGLVTKTPVLKQGLSLKFCIPSICYFLTGLLYLHALTITSPPIWIILIQTRTLYTAIIYKVQFSKDVSKMQGVGCLFIVLSIPLTHLADLLSNNVTLTTEILVMSQAAALLSSVACLAVEIFLKNDSRSFVEQQFNLYSWGIISAFLAFVFVDNLLMLPSYIKNVQKDSQIMWYLAISIVLTSLAGLCVPIIVKNLDSIVKDYMAALNNIVVAALTALIFPALFAINRVYILSLAILILGIVLYETKFTSRKS